MSFPLLVPAAAPGARGRLAARGQRILSIFSFLTALVCAVGAQAQSTSPHDVPDAEPSLPPVVVTATRMPEPARNVLSDVTVIGADQVEAASGRSLLDLLADQPGIQSYQQGGMGKLSGVFIRGGASNQTLLLIDGMRYGSLTAGGPALDGIPLGLIDHIEIVRGPMSSVYGADAAAGVIQVFTKKAAQPGVHGSASATLGADGFAEAGAGFQVRTADVDFGVQADRVRTSGFSATNAKDVYDYNPDRDGWRQSSGSMQLGYRINADWKVSAHALYAQGYTGFDDGPDPSPSQPLHSEALLRNQVWGLTASGHILPSWQTSVQYQTSQDIYNTLVAASPYSLGAAVSGQRQSSWLNTLDTAAGRLLLGLEHLDQSIAGTTMADFPVQDRKVESGLAGLQGQAGAHHWQVSVRGDQNSEYGHHTTGAAAYGYDVSPTVRLHASVSNSFVAPTFDQLYYPGFSNPHLLPEQGHNREAGVRYLAGGQEVQLTYFDNRVRDFIVAGASPVNVPRTTMEGTTLSYARRWTLWRVRASWDHLHARNDATGARLARVADDSANVDVEREMGAWSAGVHVRTVGPRVDYLPSLTMGGYTVVDAHLRWQVKSAISVFARIDNLTDRRYETSYGYNEPRRGLFVGMSWSD